MRKTCFLICAVAASEASLAGGFALIEQGASGLGNAYAGAAAVTQDASTVWFNPAGMSELKERQFLGAAHVIGVDGDFSDKGTTLGQQLGLGYVDPAFGTAAAGGKTDASGTSFIPNLYYVHPLKRNVTLGIGLSVPFGNSTDYDSGWVGRYQAIESAVSVIDINPSISYKVNDQLNIGGGISIQRMSATLGSAVDNGAICFGAVPAAFQEANCLSAGLLPGTASSDGSVDVEGESTAMSFNLGLLYKPRIGTKLGLAYRHGVKHDLEGDVDFTYNAGLQQLFTDAQIPLPLPDSDVTAKADLPPSLMFSAAHQVNDQIEVLADATYTGWSSLPELRITRDSGEDVTLTNFGFEDVWRLSAGLNYSHTDALTFRAGVAYDEDPVPSPQLRTARIPGNERVWAAFGLGYKFSNTVAFDVGFAHLMIDDTPLANPSLATDGTASTTGTTTRGVFETSANILSAQVTVQFN